MFIPNDPYLIVNLVRVLVKIAIIILVVILIIKTIKYFKRKEEREIRCDYRSAQNTIDEIERELNEKREQP